MHQNIKSHIAVIEDDFGQRRDLVEYLQLHDFLVQGFESAETFYKAWPNCTFDLAVIDIGLPGENGLQVAQWLRSHNQTTGIVMLTAMGESDEQVVGLETGADAYLVKEASLDLIAATCRSVLRRLTPPSEPSPQTDTPAVMPPWHLAVRSWQLTPPTETPIKLTHTETVFLHCLIQDIGNPVSRSELLTAMDKADTVANRRNLDNCASRLRRKLLKACGVEVPVRPSYGSGYTFTGDALIEE